MPDWVGLVSFFIGIGGAIVGLFAFVHQLRGAKRQNAKMALVAGEMSTHYIGTFPKHLDDIIALADRAHEKLCIMADCVDYGSFSAPDIHQKSLEAIIKCIRERRVKVQLVLHGEPVHISSSSPFYDKTFEQLKDDPQFMECLSSYLALHHQATRPTTDEEFRKMLLDAHERFQYLLLDAGAEIHKFKKKPDGQATRALEKPGVFFWLEDDEAAVFLLALTGNEARGLAFRTRDGTLLKMFASTFTDYRKASDAIERGEPAKADVISSS
jgi:hypothetical protein